MLVDTNILIAYLGGDERVKNALFELRSERGALFLSTIVEAELLCFEGWNLRERVAIERFLEENFVSIPFDRKMAMTAADIRRDVKLKFPDVAIAATALALDVPIITRDKEFKKIRGLLIVII